MIEHPEGETSGCRCSKASLRNFRRGRTGRAVCSGLATCGACRTLVPGAPLPGNTYVGHRQVWVQHILVVLAGSHKGGSKYLERGRASKRTFMHGRAAGARYFGPPIGRSLLGGIASTYGWSTLQTAKQWPGLMDDLVVPFPAPLIVHCTKERRVRKCSQKLDFQKSIL